MDHHEEYKGHDISVSTRKVGRGYMWSYTVNGDCTGTLTVEVPNGPSFDLFIAPDGEQFARIPTAPPGNYGAVIDRRVSRK